MRVLQFVLLLILELSGNAVFGQSAFDSICGYRHVLNIHIEESPKITIDKVKSSITVELPGRPYRERYEFKDGFFWTTDTLPSNITAGHYIRDEKGRDLKMVTAGAKPKNKTIRDLPLQNGDSVYAYAEKDLNADQVSDVITIEKGVRRHYNGTDITGYSVQPYFKTKSGYEPCLSVQLWGSRVDGFLITPIVYDGKYVILVFYETYPPEPQKIMCMILSK